MFKSLLMMFFISLISLQGVVFEKKETVSTVIEQQEKRKI